MTDSIRDHGDGRDPPPPAAGRRGRARARRDSRRVAARSAHAQAAFDWKRYKGEPIEVLLVKSPRGDLLTKYHKEFEDLTGISVGSEMIPEQQQRQKAVIEFNSGNPSFDVIAAFVSRAEAPVRQEQLAHRPSPDARRQVGHRSESRFRRFRQGRPQLRRRARRSRQQPADEPRSVGRLLQQGAVRRQGHRVSEDLRRDDRCRGEAQRPVEGRVRLRRARAQECQRPGVDQLPARLRRRLRRQERQAHDRLAGGDRRRRRCTSCCWPSTVPPASPATTGTSRRACSCRARPRCGSTASASRSRSRIRPSRASSARSATA